jgi:hypothetical protein
MPKSFESKAFKASPSSGSLKTTVPISVATVLGLEPGSSILWEVDVESRSARVVKGEATRQRRTSVRESAISKSSR